MEQFLNIFKEHEEELEVACPDFAVRVQELMQADIVAGNRVGSRYSKHFSEDITMRCGETKKKKEGDQAPPTTPPKKIMNSPPSLSLEQRIKLQLEEKMAEDREMSQLVASMEEKILANEDDALVEVNFDKSKIAHAQAMFVEMCDDCGMRHLQDLRECDMCGEVHEKCCEL